MPTCTCAHLRECEHAHREKAPDCPLCPPWSYKLGDRRSQPVLSSGESRLSRAPARPVEVLGVPGALLPSVLGPWGSLPLIMAASWLTPRSRWARN